MCWATQRGDIKTQAKKYRLPKWHKGVNQNKAKKSDLEATVYLCFLINIAIILEGTAKRYSVAYANWVGIPYIYCLTSNNNIIDEW